MKIEFLKIHGLGNDFIVVAELEQTKIPEDKKAAFAKKFCSRKFSVGADGVLFLQPSQKADFKMRIFNADGSEAETCINGLRCAALQKFFIDGGKEMSIETIQGKVNARLLQENPFSAQVEIEFLGNVLTGKKDYVEVNGVGFDFFPVNVGNPHAVVFLEEPVEDFAVEETGHAFEYHEKFAPARVNTEFVNVLSPVSVKMRVHERGACETLACGSGSIAVVAAGLEEGLLKEGEWVSVEQPGGFLKIKMGKQLLLQGPAEKVFVGEFEWG